MAVIVVHHKIVLDMIAWLWFHLHMKTWFIYALCDPNTEAVRYIGWTYDVKRRLAQHRQRALSETTHKANWLNRLRALGFSPEVTILESGDKSWAKAEQRWIAYYRAMGNDLVNATNGGEGVPGIVFSVETREKMAQAKRGRKLPGDVAAKLVAALRGRPVSEETRMKIAAKLRGRKRPIECVRRMAQAMTGRHHSEATRRKMSASRRGHVMLAETKAKISAAHKRKTLSKEHREKLSAAKKGRPLSEAHKAKLRVSCRGWHHTPEARARISSARKASMTAPPPKNGST